TVLRRFDCLLAPTKAAVLARHGAGLEKLLIETLAKELDLKGSLHVLRHGFKFYGKTFRVAAPRQPKRAVRPPCAFLRAYPGRRRQDDALSVVQWLCMLTPDGFDAGSGWRWLLQQVELGRHLHELGELGLRGGPSM